MSSDLGPYAVDAFADEAYPLIIRDADHRYTSLPILYKDLWDLYKKEALPSTWFFENLDLTEDLDCWNNKLTDNERHFLKYVLCFFAGADSLVADNLSVNFVEEVQVKEISVFYQWQAFNEAIHAETYSNLIELYFQDNDEERAAVFEAVTKLPVIEAKTTWALQFSDRECASFAERLVGFICLEGIMFAGSFAAIFYFRSRGLLPGLSEANQYIQADESLHVRFAIKVYELVKERLPQERVHEIFRSAVDTEVEFLTEALPVRLIGLRNEDMCQYIKFVADFWLNEMKYEKIYKVENPLGYMDRISMKTKSNFFETRNTQYQTVQTSMTETERSFGLDAEF